MKTNTRFLEVPWQATLHVERVPIGWAIAASAWPAAEDASADDYDHEWWLGLTAGGTTRWYSSSAARSENGLVDDGPFIDALWVKATGALEVVVDFWIMLGDEDGNAVERAYRAVHVVSEAGKQHAALVFTNQWQRPATAAFAKLEPHERVVLPIGSDHPTSAIVPGMGLLETDREGWLLNETRGRTQLPGFVPAGAKALEAITTSHDGRVAVVWTINQTWHIALYQLPSPTPLAMIPPNPSANGNSPLPGRFIAGGIALLPISPREIGIIDTTRGEVRHRLSAGGYVGKVGLDGDASRVWIAGHGHARCYDATTGAALEDHRIPDSYGDNTAFDARGRRTYSYDVFAYEPDAVTALNWYDLDGSTGQLLIPDSIDYALTPVDRGVVALGRTGLWFADVERGQLALVTVPFAVRFFATHPIFAAREGNQLIVWTQVPAHFRVTISLPES